MTVVACRCGHRRDEHWRDSGPCMVATETVAWACDCDEYRLPRPPALRHPRWLARLRAALGGYFWLPCPVCGRPFGGQEWDWVSGCEVTYEPCRGRAVCSPRCAAVGAEQVEAATFGQGDYR